ncbi:uncharacterized protein LOC134531147 isoform X2 [Bacillus rossius redtenbacheri]|uniref:uncharacterized protein LOC134531147 isoform X2 n=1 Tax=Bacillus rossius redtenbacheri TaxID=93214 RepID=UPI002FDE52DD
MKYKGYVSKVVTKQNKLPPILVSFEHGDLLPGEVAGLRCAVLRNPDDEQRLVAVATPHLQYTSRVPSGAGLTTTFIAVHNKKTNKVRLIETECFTLLPSIAKETGAAAADDVVDVSVQYAQLSKSFGSKMAKRKQEQIERTTINADNLEGQLAELTQTMEVAEEDLTFSKDGSSLRELLPPRNPEATGVSQVYELTNILSAEELESLDIICDEVLTEPKSYIRHSPSHLFDHCLIALLVNQDRTRLKALLYADCLIKFVRLNVKDLSKKDLVLCPYSVLISNNILNNFTTSVGNKRNRPLTHRDKALCHIIVLGLLACGYQLDLKPLVKSFQRVGLAKLQALSRVVGAVPSKNKPDVIELKFPVTSMRETIRHTKIGRKN